MKFVLRAALVLLVGANHLYAQGDGSVRLAEAFAPGAQYHVSCRVAINGTLPLPAEKQQGGARTLSVKGSSAIEYDERILRADTRGHVERTVRWYSRLDFERTIDKEEQSSSLRPEARRLVILRRKHTEVPFCPNAPLTWGELELVRTDVFAPALKALLPAGAVRPGERWKAGTEALQELTDVEQITQGELTCRLITTTSPSGRKQAKVAFGGRVRGVGEDGPALHDLEGYFFFDLQGGYLSYLYVRGTHYLLDRDGRQQGKVEGSFTMTREPQPRGKELSDAVLRGMALEPNEDNTRLLFAQPQLGLRFLYPRGWRITGTNPQNVGLDNGRGSGLLIALDPPSKQPTAAQFMQAVRQGLAQQRVKVLRMDAAARSVQPGLETFGADAEVNKQPLRMQYYVVRGTAGGATVTATLQARDAAAQREAEAIARSVQLAAPK